MNPRTRLRLIINWYRDRIHRWCFYCGEPLNKFTRTRDHVVPKSKGGRKTVSCCKRCNILKADLSVEEFRLLLYKHSTIEFYGEQLYRTKYNP
jgi:5-methylcytosine-specific restriction endonuclease McrA